MFQKYAYRSSRSHASAVSGEKPDLRYCITSSYENRLAACMADKMACNSGFCRISTVPAKYAPIPALCSMGFKALT